MRRGRWVAISPFPFREHAPHEHRRQPAPLLGLKSATQVRRQIEHFGLADVVAMIGPKGCLMAGDYDKPWQRPKTRRPKEER
jgi:hypothetical protein